MVKRRPLRLVALIAVFVFAAAARAEDAGIIRGMVYDKDSETPLAAAQVSIAETGKMVTATDGGNYVFNQVEPGTYTLVFSKEGYTRQVTANVVVSPGKITEADASLSGEVTEMEEFVVQDMQMGGGTEAALLDLRVESPALMDSIGSELMSQAGASDAASALKLIAGTTVQDGKYAVVRGLPDRYVNSQMNGVRLPTADADKRAVQLDQFPSAVIESIQVSKTFTPDQQGDASGGAVNVVTKGIPDETMFQLSSELSWNTQTAGRDDFLTYKDGGVSFWGEDDGGRDVQQVTAPPSSWDGAAGVSRGDAPQNYKWSLAGGGKHELDSGIKVGGFGNFFYEQSSSFFDNGINDKYWVENPGDKKMTPQYFQGIPSGEMFNTALFDVTQGREKVKWGGLGTLGVETENHSLALTYLYTQDAEDVATLAEDTRGKAYYFPGYNPNDPTAPGNQLRTAAPYLRAETLEYTERTTQTLQLRGRHKLVPDLNTGLEKRFMFQSPELDWTVAHSSATLDQPDKRQFGSMWSAESSDPLFPGFIFPAAYSPYKPAANFTVGNFQRIWKDISEDSEQYFVNVKFPFEQWSEDKGYLKFGVFSDKVNREYNQDSFSNFGDENAQYFAPFENFWSEVFPSENHPITASNIDVDYTGEQKISAWYYMADMPLCSFFNIIGGVRYETTELSIINKPEGDVRWIPPGATQWVTLNPGDADVSFKQDDVLPSIGFELRPIEKTTLRGSYSETIARQTFKELTPIQQQEFLGGDVFIGNPRLKMSSLKNYDLRLDYTPYEGGLISGSYFYKEIKDPIEYVQKVVEFGFTTPVNFPQGTLSGYEIEVRQQMWRLWKELEGLSVGANATFIHSEVTLPDDEAAIFDRLNVPMRKRDMLNTPSHLYNFYLTYDIKPTCTNLALFYTIIGDTLVAGAGESSGHFVPSVYAREYGTLNFSASQKIGDIWKFKFQAKNLLDPEIETVYRSKYIGDDVTKTSYRKGREFSISLSAEF